MMKPVFLGKYLLAACWCAAFPAAEAGAGTAQLHPASGDSLPSLCRVLDRGPVLYRNDSSWIRKVKLTLIGQYQAAAVSPNGANKFCPSSGGMQGKMPEFSHLRFRASWYLQSPYFRRPERY